MILWGRGQEVHADQCVWFKLHKKRPFDFNRGGGGQDVKKKVKDIFQKKYPGPRVNSFVN